MQYTEAEKVQIAELEKRIECIDNDITDFQVENCMIEVESEEETFNRECDEAWKREQEEEYAYYSGLCNTADKLKQELFEIRNAALSRERKSLWDEEIKTFAKGSLVNEYISDMHLKSDIFNRKQKASAIAEEICDEKICSPYNIAILGNWGTGKTTFCRHIKDAIESKNKEKNRNIYKIVDFNAADYSSKVLNESHSEHVEQQWSNLLKTMFESYEAEHPVIGAIRYNRIRFWGKKPFGQILLYFLLTILAFAPLIFFKCAPVALKISDTNKKVFESVSGVMGTILLFIPVLKSAFVTMIPISDRVKKATELPKYVDILGTRERIVFDANMLIKAWTRKDDEKVIVFVDDCDRCSIEGVMELFEAMHLFLNLENVFFVFAIDPRLLKDAIAKYYCRDGSDALVAQFLQKYVSRIYLLEEPNYASLVHSLKKTIEPEQEGKHCLTDEEYSNFLEYIRSEPNTPRSVKQIMNTIVSLKNYYMSDPDLGERFSFKALMGWYLMNYYYTSTCEQIRLLLTKNKSRHKLKDLVNKNTAEKLKKTKLFETIGDYYTRDFISIEQNMGMMIRRYAFSDSIKLTEEIE